MFQYYYELLLKYFLFIKRVIMHYDAVVVGAGLSGSIVAERLASKGKKVLIIEKRDHIAGNIYDRYNNDGILIHEYGPHLFHTNSKMVFEYLSKFTKWIKYEHKVLAYVDGKYVPIPINRTTINLIYGLNLSTDEEAAKYLDGVKGTYGKITNAKEAVVSKVGYDLYKKLFEGYTKKQWGMDPEELSPEITQRIPVRVNTDDRYFTDIYQMMPLEGYTKMVERILSNDNIEIRLNSDYKDIINEIDYDILVYTGQIDYFFDYKYGRLRYRSLRFEFLTYEQEIVQPVAVINYPDEKIPYTRCMEFKHATGQKCKKTTIEREYPQSEGGPYYPMLTEQDKDLYLKYEKESKLIKNTFFVGRLAEFKYYNMDQAAASALKISGSILKLLDKE